MSDLSTLLAEQAALIHAMQSGVAACGGTPALDAEQSPKHLRVGINNALCMTGTLVSLLIDKGIFTALEWNEAYNSTLKAEVKDYEELLSHHYGTKVTLA